MSSRRVVPAHAEVRGQPAFHRPAARLGRQQRPFVVEDPADLLLAFAPATSRAQPAADPTLKALVAAIHDGHDGKPIWIVPWEGPSPKAWVALEELARADLDGLEAADYLPAGAPPTDFRTGPDLLYHIDEDFDRALTRGMLRYLMDVRHGTDGAPRTAGDWRDAALELGKGLATEGPEAFRAWLGDVRPGAADYAALRAARARLLELAEAPWPALELDEALKPGQTHPAVPTIRERLRLLGDLTDDATGAGERLYDPMLEAAVRAFQARHGLEIDGVIGRATKAALDLTPAARARTVALNMDRLRWLDGRLSGRHVIVNIAGFTLTAVEADGTRLTMPVVVGKNGRRTPVMTDAITAVTFRPTWTVPTNIARDDLLPKIKADPGYFAANDMVVFESWAPDAGIVDPATVDWSQVGRDGISRYKLRQNPGPTNALVNQVVNVTISAWDVFPDDRAAGFVYEVDWADGSSSPVSRTARSASCSAGPSAPSLRAASASARPSPWPASPWPTYPSGPTRPSARPCAGARAPPSSACPRRSPCM